MFPVCRRVADVHAIVRTFAAYIDMDGNIMETAKFLSIGLFIHLFNISVVVGNSARLQDIVQKVENQPVD